MSFTPTMFKQFNSPYMSVFYNKAMLQHHNTIIGEKIRQALRAHFNCYCEMEFKRMTLQSPIKRKESKSKEIKPITIQLISSDQEISEENSKIKTLDSNVKISEKVTQEVIDEKTDQSRDLEINMHSERLSDLESNSNIVKKTVLIKKDKSTKIKSRCRGINVQDIYSKLDLTQTVNLKNNTISLHQINRKKKALLMRNVINWDEAIKGRKQRREIRMLKN